MSLYRKSDRMYKLEERIRTETDWAYEVVDQQVAMGVFEVMGLQVLTSQGPLTICDDGELDLAIAQGVA